MREIYTTLRHSHKLTRLHRCHGLYICNYFSGCEEMAGLLTKGKAWLSAKPTSSLAQTTSLLNTVMKQHQEDLNKKIDTSQ